jgi:lipopolysaccharide biosynthesis protein
MKGELNIVAFKQYATNVDRSRHYRDRSALPASGPDAYPVKFIAYYLPQYHRIAENDAWWGEGFTEWTNVAKALPRYRGHYQPRMPGALGFYDLSNADVIRAQAKLAAQGGIYGFCIHDYWFDGKRVLETPLQTILANTDIDIRFCINWANENWTRTWDGLEKDVLLQQRYSDEGDIAYAHHLVKIVKDHRYIRIGGQPIIMVYRPSLLPDAVATFERWRQVFRSAGEAEPFLIMPQAFGNEDPRMFNMDAAAGFPPHRCGALVPNRASSLPLLDPAFRGEARAYDKLIEAERLLRPTDYTLFPGVCPNWDNEARKPGRGAGFYGSTPNLYGEWLHDAATYRLERDDHDRAIVFINAWNEWGEGAYLEPDRHYGYAYLAETRITLDRLASDNTQRSVVATDPADRLVVPKQLRRFVNVGRRMAMRAWRRMTKQS